MAVISVPDFEKLSIEDLREKFDLCVQAQQYKLNFKEFALLYRIMEGVKTSHIFESLYLSHATVSRSRHSLTEKLSAKSFEQALILVGRLDLLWGSEE